MQRPYGEANEDAQYLYTWCVPVFMHTGTSEHVLKGVPAAARELLLRDHPGGLTPPAFHASGSASRVRARCSDTSQYECFLRHLFFVQANDNIVQWRHGYEVD